MQKQYRIESLETFADGEGKMVYANIFASEVIDRGDRLELRFEGYFLGAVYKSAARIVLCPHEAALDKLSERHITVEPKVTQ